MPFTLYQEDGMALVFHCPHCGGQNFVAPERLGHRERPVMCWICGREIPWDFLESLASGQGTREGKEGDKRGGKEWE